jgi:hypothetical protein
VEGQVYTRMNGEHLDAVVGKIQHQLARTLNQLGLRPFCLVLPHIGTEPETLADGGCMVMTQQLFDAKRRLGWNDW